MPAGIMSELGLFTRLWRFGAVGIATALVHASIGTGLHYGFDVAAFWANAVAFGFALVVSFVGQTRLTFPEAKVDHAAFLRFAGVALLTLAMNQLIVWTVARLGGPYWLSLGLIYLTVPPLGFAALRYWALRR